MALSRKIFAATAVTAACSAAVLFGPLDLARARHGAGGRHATTEGPGCSSAHGHGHGHANGNGNGHGHGNGNGHAYGQGHAHGRRGPSTSSPGTQSISVFVPPTALVRVDAAGHVIAAATNTGCRPVQSDDFFTIHADGSVNRARPGEYAAQHWTGDFAAPGVYVAQR